ncbi:hypothetical protein [Halogeometricum borinquense]|uniref:hypothetical protein n=1 Tax=Halogeometricum borinquense TaxID=60847 RepID=UPI0034352035
MALNTNETLEDATFYLPLPVEADKPDLSAAMVETGTTVGDNISYRVVETEYGRMLELSADRVTVTPHYYEFVEKNGVDRRVEISASEYDPSDPNMTRDANAGTRLRVSVPVEEPVSTADPWASNRCLPHVRTVGPQPAASHQVARSVVLPTRRRCTPTTKRTGQRE